MEEPTPVFSKTYQVQDGERQPLLIYNHDSNWRDVVETFVRYHELDAKTRTQILTDVRQKLETN